MSLQAMNAVAALAIMRQAGAGTEDTQRAVALSAVVPGILGLAVPLVAAQNVDRDNGDSDAVETVSTHRKVDRAVVPGVVGQKVEDAKQQLRAAHLRPQVSYAYSDDTLDTVISQDPAAHQPVSLSGPVSIIVSAGPDQTQIESTEQELLARLKSLMPTLSQLTKEMEAYTGQSGGGGMTSQSGAAGSGSGATGASGPGPSGTGNPAPAATGSSGATGGAADPTGGTAPKKGGGPT